MAALLQQFAKAIAEAIPDVEGRCFAVSETDPLDHTNTTVTLPVAYVALAGESAGQAKRGGGGRVQITSMVDVEFIFKPIKYQTATQEDTPFYAFYDYEALRNKMLELVSNWRSDKNTGFTYKSLDVEATTHAVFILLRFESQEEWCPGGDQQHEGVVSVTGRIVQPSKAPCIAQTVQDPCDK